MEQLVKAYEENELAADRVYKGKLAAITGKVESVNEMLGQRFVILKPDYLSIGGVRCHFEREHVEQLVKLKAEQVITVQGKIDGYGLASVTVENCTIKSEIPASDVKPASVVTSESGVIEVTVEQLVKAYESNELAADRVYKGKLAAITGKVESVNEMLGQRFVILKPDYLSISGVRCHFEREHVEQLVKLKAEQVITVQGKIDGYGLASVTVENCTIKSEIPASDVKPASVVTSESGVIEVTVEQLVKAYESNELAADRVYKGKLAAITGKVESVNEMLGRRFVVLEPDYLSIIDVSCYFEREHVEQLVKLKKGQVITVQGKIDGYGLARVEVENCTVKPAA